MPPPAAAAAHLDGTLFYLGIGTHGGLYSLHGTTVATVVPDSSFMFYQSAVVSPDGHKVAYVLGEQAGSTGQLRVLTIGGGAVTMGPSTITNVQPPQWSADGTGIYVAYGSTQFGLINVATGAISPVTSASGCCFTLRSPDGAFAIVASGATINVTHADGSSPVLGHTPAGKVWTRLQSLSPDGHNVTGFLHNVGEPGGDAGRFLGSNSLVDLATGATAAVPGGGTLKQAFYLANGNLIVRVGVGSATQVRLVSPAGAILDQIVEPADATSLVLLSYAP